MTALESRAKAATNGTSKSRFWQLSLGSAGVVYGDIGTSPLYAIRESLKQVAGDGITRHEVIGVVSLLLWALMIVVTIKYVWFLTRADNRGEGGVLSLMALCQRAVGRGAGVVFVLGVAGGALFYGDALITPSISVLAAVEGLELVTPVFQPYIVWIALAILFALFAVQSHGTARVSFVFGPVCVVFFLTIAGLGIRHIADDPGILWAFNPLIGLEFLVNHRLGSLVVLGSIFLAVTGAEALYADMGHFGAKPIRATWMALVFPSLSLNYLGQGALVLAHPEALKNPFFLMAPPWMLLGLVILATFATIIASQAVITGTFSITRQAIQLGLLPRILITHTSEQHEGQIYISQVNTLLLIGVIALVLSFKSSGALASAYGITVTATMVVTSCLAFVLVHRIWRFSLWSSVAIMAPFMIVDVSFFSSSLLKITDGGYVPVGIAIAMTLIMWTWSRGVAILSRAAARDSLPVADFASMIRRSHPLRTPGNAIFLTSDPDDTPRALLHNLKHNHVLHENTMLLTIRTSDQPRVPNSDKVQIDRKITDLVRVMATFGYMETPSIPRILALMREEGMELNLMDTSFFLGRSSLRAARNFGMPLWQDRLFIRLYKMSATAIDYFRIPPNRVIEMGGQVTI